MYSSPPPLHLLPSPHTPLTTTQKLEKQVNTKQQQRMAPKPYPGSCHCGLVTYTVNLDLEQQQTPDPNNNPNDQTKPSSSSSSSSTTTTTTTTTKTGKCNCSICAKTRSWETLVPPSAFHLNPTSPPHLTEYRFGTQKVAHLFCKVCGCRPFGRGTWESSGSSEEEGGWRGEFVAVQLACLDGVEDAVLEGLEVVFRNGREGAFGERPGVVGHL